MTITLPTDLEESIRHYIASGFYATEEEAIRAAFQLLELRQRKLTKLRASVRQSREEMERGDVVELTDELWDRLIGEVEELVRRGVEPPADAWP